MFGIDFKSVGITIILLVIAVALVNIFTKETIVMADSLNGTVKKGFGLPDFGTKITK